MVIYRDKHGRFVSKKSRKKKTRHLVKLKRNRFGQFVGRKRKAKPYQERIQLSKALTSKKNVKGYYITIESLVPAEFETDSTPTFEGAEKADAWHRVIWRTTLAQTAARSVVLARQDLGQFFEALMQKETYELERQNADYLILSYELVELRNDYSHHILAVWNTDEAPKRVKAWLKLH